MKILIVEDEISIANGLQFNFEQEGYDAAIAGDGPTALQLIESDDSIALVVLDLMLPGMSGYEICKEIRATKLSLPVLVLSARRTSEDKAHAFDCGADQYVTKPFDLREVLSRVRSLLKSRTNDAESDAPQESTAVFRFDKVVIDCAQFEVIVENEVHSLTTTEMQLLRFFLENEGKVLSRARIMEVVWGQSSDITTRTIDNFVMRLRRIIEPEPSRPKYLLSVRGTGYRFALKSRVTDG